MTIDYTLPKPTAGSSRATSPTEAEIMADISDTIADVGSRLDVVENGASSAPTASRFAPTGAISESTDRNAGGIGNLPVITSGQLQLVAIPLDAGQTVTNLVFRSGTTAAATSSHCWFSLWTPARGKLAVTADDTAGSPWAANTTKSMALTAPYEVTEPGLYYAGVVVVATTPPTMFGAVSSANMTGQVPILTGSSTTGLTDPTSAPATAAAIVAFGSLPYVYVT